MTGVPVAWPVLAALLLAGCSSGTPDDRDDEADGDDEGMTLPDGILFRHPEGSLAAVDGSVDDVPLMTGGFDVASGTVAQGDNEQGIRVWDADGERTVELSGVYHVGRVSLSPDARHAVFQATTTSAPPTSPETNDFNIYRADLDTSDVRRLSPLTGGLLPEESPEWSRAGDLIAYSSFSPVSGIDLHIIDAESGDELRVIDEAGGIHLSFSHDGKSIVEAGRLRVYDVATGEMTHDLRDEAIAAAERDGYELDTRFPGQANRGTFPLDSAFSPGADNLVFDGAVTRDGQPGILIMTLTLDGDDFEVVAGPFTVDPGTTNNLNYSETNPLWN